MTNPYYSDDYVTLYHGNCLELTDVWAGADVLVTDPPYGIGYATGTKHAADTAHELIAGDDRPFDPTHLLAFERAVIFGGNNFASKLPDSGAWIVWDKTIQNDLKVRIAECELAWTRGVLRRTRALRHLWSGNFRASEQGTKYHPSQKPERLMGWVIGLVSEPGDVIADPYAGSGSTGVAAKALGRRAILVELEERYCEIAARRLTQDVLDFGGPA